VVNFIELRPNNSSFISFSFLSRPRLAKGHHEVERFTLSWPKKERKQEIVSPFISFILCCTGPRNTCREAVAESQSCDNKDKKEMYQELFGCNRHKAPLRGHHLMSCSHSTVPE
jgi:hypothetical protein